jgi:hypothetical protein
MRQLSIRWCQKNFFTEGDLVMLRHQPIEHILCPAGGSVHAYSPNFHLPDKLRLLPLGVVQSTKPYLKLYICTFCKKPIDRSWRLYIPDFVSRQVNLTLLDDQITYLSDWYWLPEWVVPITRVEADMFLRSMINEDSP